MLDIKFYFREKVTRNPSICHYIHSKLSPIFKLQYFDTVCS